MSDPRPPAGGKASLKHDAGSVSEPVVDVSGLPTVVFGTRTTLWLGFVGVIVVEGMMIFLIIVAYLYLGARAKQWPPGAAPALTASAVNTALFALSTVPAVWLKRRAAQADLTAVRRLLCTLSAIAIATIVVSLWGFASLPVRWEANAYASLVWMLLGTHALVLLAAALMVWVLTIVMLTPRVEGRRYMNVYDSGDYWLLAAFLWLATWLVAYVSPRLL